MPYFYLEIVKGAEQGKRYLLHDGAVSIGRSSSNSITMHSCEKAVSGHHAIIYKSPDKIMIQDMQSTNGTFVDEDRINEKELSPGVIIGLGKTGPRLKLIVSDTELTTGQVVEAAPKENTGARTIENDGLENEASSKSGGNITRTASGIISKPQHSGSEPIIPQAESLTMDMERKLVEKRMDVDDMHSLMKDEKRLEKILDRGKISDTQSSMLVSAYGARKKTRNQWMIIVGIVSAISLLVILFLGIRVYQYSQMLEKGLSLEEKLDIYEAKISKANDNPDINKNELAKLILELEETKKQLASVKENLKEDDFVKFYTDTTEKLIDNIMMRFGEADYHIPEEMVNRVKYHISIYSGRLKSIITRYFQRKNVYFPMIRDVLERENLPVELAYISMLESGFNPKALSHAGARGLWQFMPATGRRYGLRVDDNVDERCNPQKATNAAAEYFKDLIAEFGGKSSIMLAMAAYNAGEGRVRGALRKIDDPMRNRDFWYIYRMGYLAEETNEYIPRVLALMIMDENPVKYGFKTSSSEVEVEVKEDDFIELEF